VVRGERGYEDAGEGHAPLDLNLVRIAGRVAVARANRIHRPGAFLLFKYLARLNKRISAMNDQQLWGWLVKWFPMLFDLLTVLLLVAGCMLIWINFRPRKRKVVRAPRQTSDQGSAPSHPSIAGQQQPRPSAEHRANYSDAFPSEEPVGSDPLEEPGNSDAAQTGSATTADQNSYADRVASAMAKLRKPSA
jgi:hypothetical protein